MVDDRKRLERSLKGQILMRAVIPVMLGMSLMAALIFYMSVKGATDFLKEDVESEARLVCERLDLHFEKYRHLVEQGKYNLELQEYFKEVDRPEKMYRNPHYRTVRKILDSLLQGEEEDELRGTLWIADVDADIEIEDSASGTALTRKDGWNFVDRPWAEEAFRQEEVYLASPYKTVKEGEVVLSVICPVRDWENQQLLGVLGIDIKVSSLEDVIKRNELKYAEKMVIIDSRGIVLSHENKDYLLKNYEVLEHPEVIKRILEKREEDLYTYQSGENEKRIGSVLESKNTGWLVMSSASEGRLKLRLWEIFQPIFLIFFISVLAAMFYEYRMLMKSALFVQSLNEDIRQASFGIQERDQQIVETMKYARLLQKKQGFGIEAAEGVFKDSAILSRTIQKVGGDFVWSKKVKNGVLIAFGDSSGYGIPGALLSVMTMSFLDTAVDTLQEPDLREILWKLEIDLSNRENDQLLAEKPELPLSASLALVYISQEGTIRFAGANCDLFREKDGMTEMVKGEAFDIGEGKAMGPESFQVSFFEPEEGVSCYLATDGFFRQESSDIGQPLGYNRMKRIVVKYKDGSIREILEKLMEEFDDYRKEETQQDDVTVFGFRV